MKLIEDLGFKPIGTQGSFKMRALYECPLCKKPFEVIKANVTSGKTTKCRACANELTNAISNEKARASLEQKVHTASNGKVSVDKDTYINSWTKIKATCLCGNTWYALPNDLKDGHGCSECTTFGFDKAKPGVLYYLKLLDGTYKIGITNGSALSRFPKRDHDKFIVLKEYKYTSGLECYRVEQLYHKAFAEYRADARLLSSGHTEVYTIDVLCLDS